MTTPYAAAYLRRSSASGDNPGDASREAQETAVRRLCGDDVVLFVDWGISGRKTDRPEYQRLRSAIEAGQISSVCAYSLSRLGRNARELLGFIELCQAHGVAVQTAVEKLDTGSAMGRAMLGIMAVFAQLEVEQGMERSAAARAARQARHDAAGVVMPTGHPGYGSRHVRGADGLSRIEPDPAHPLAPIVAAYREAGSVLGATKLLQERGIPAPRGGTRWGTSTLTRVLEAAAPDLLPRRSHTGMRTPANSMLAQLLRCPFCGATLTPNTARGQYYCRFGARDRDAHPRYAVRERDLLPWVEAEAARFIVPVDRVDLQERDARDVARIKAEREKVLDAYQAGAMTRDSMLRRIEALDTRAAAVAVAESIVDVPPAIDWDGWEPRAINTYLRAIWDHVELGPDMRPIRASWQVPEEYVAP
jgi:DNA invertase Pin-like site-specific DNA recombinase